MSFSTPAKPGSNSEPGSKLKPESNRQYPGGSTFDKVFDEATFTGTVVAFNAKEGFYSIRYNKGDAEELDEKDLTGLIAASNTASLKY